MNNDDTTTSQDSKKSPSAYSWYVAILFAIFFVFSFVDRQIIGVLVPDMKGELNLSDIQLSYIGGLSFVIFYTVFGIPLGRLADSYNRKWLIIVGVVIWTVSTTACGLANNFWQLLILRMGVGLGEAALAPCAYSILTDVFPRHRLTMAISICTMGGAFGFGFAFLGGALILGWANTLAGDAGLIDVPMFGELAPWRIVFLAIGIPGLLFSLLLFTVREPVRIGGGTKVPPISDVLRYLKKHWLAFTAIFAGIGFLNVASYGSAFWDITFFERTHGWSPDESGVYYGILATAGQFIGAFIAGIISDRLAQNSGADAKMRILLVIAFVSLWLRIIYPLMPTVGTTLVLIFPIYVLSGAPFGVAATALQIMSPMRMRGQITAVYFFAQSLLGLGLGPTLVAFLTEQVFQDLSMLKYSLMITGGLGMLVSASLFFMGRSHYLETLIDAEKINRENAEQSF